MRWKPGREHVEEHAPDELGRCQRHGLLAGRAGPAIVLVAEAHAAVVEAAQALVADGDPVGVTAEVVEDLLGTGEGSLRVDHPFGLAGRSEVLGEAPGVVEGVQPTGETQLAGLEGVRPAARGGGPDGSSVTGPRTGRKNPGRQATHPLPSVASPPPGITQCRCG